MVMALHLTLRSQAIGEIAGDMPVSFEQVVHSSHAFLFRDRVRLRNRRFVVVVVVVRAITWP